MPHNRHRRLAARRARQALRRRGRAALLRSLATQLSPIVEDLRWTWSGDLTRRRALLRLWSALYWARHTQPSRRAEISYLRLLISLGFVEPHGRRLYLTSENHE